MTCPVCDRDVKLSSPGADWCPVLVFHFDERTGQECRASRRTLEMAWVVRERIDYSAGGEKKAEAHD